MAKKGIVRREHKHRLKDNVHDFLSYFGEIALMSTEVFITPGRLWRAAFEPFANEMAAERRRIGEIVERKRQLQSLKRAKLIKERKTARGLEYALTKKGVEVLVREKILRESSVLKNRYCLTSFDIPESQRHVRKMFRQFLKEAGFFRVHKSLWATDKDVAEHMLQLVRLAGVERWINIFVAEPLLINLEKKKRRQASEVAITD